MRSEDGQLISNASQLQPGDQITTRFAAGASISRVEEIRDDPSELARAHAAEGTCET
jgi:hypothetical protein